MLDTGFYIKENVLSNEECDELVRALSTAEIRRTRAGARNLMAVPAVAKIAVDQRFRNITRLLSGADLTPYKATLFDKSDRSNWLVAWHQDTALPIKNTINKKGWNALSVKSGIRYVHAPASALSKVLALRLHLDPSTPTNGSLRVIPGSHLFGVMSEEEITRAVGNTASSTCLIGRGGVLAMSPLLLHASSKVSTDESRRVLHIEYTQSLEIEPRVTLAIA